MWLILKKGQGVLWKWHYSSTRDGIAYSTQSVGDGYHKAVHCSSTAHWTSPKYITALVAFVVDCSVPSSFFLLIDNRTELTKHSIKIQNIQNVSTSRGASYIFSWLVSISRYHVVLECRRYSTTNRCAPGVFSYLFWPRGRSSLPQSFPLRLLSSITVYILLLDMLYL